MANPQPEKGHIDIANSIADHLCCYRLNGQEWQILWVVIRKTWGYAVTDKRGNPVRNDNGMVIKKKMDRITLGQFTSMTGIDRRKCHKLLQGLVKKQVVKKHVIQRGGSFRVSYGIQKDYDKWRVSPKKVTVIHKGDRVTPKRMTKVTPKKSRSKDNKDNSSKDSQSNLDGFDDTVIFLSMLLRDKILRNKPDRRQPDVRSSAWLERTAKAIDKMNRLDHRSPLRIEDVIRWCQADNKPRDGDFCWANNILSGDKLRLKFDDLEVQMLNSKKKSEPECTARGW